MSTYSYQLNPTTGELDLVVDESQFHVKAPVATYNSLPVTGNSENDMRFTEDTDNAYVWSIASSSGNLTDWKMIPILSNLTQDMVADGSTYAKVKATELSSGQVKQIRAVTATTDLSGDTIKTATDKAHTQNSDTYLAKDTVNEVTASNAKDAVDKKHSQGTDQGLDTGGVNAVTAAQAKTAYDHSQITTGNPHNLDATDVGAEVSGAVSSHSGLTTGVHGVGVGTVAKVADIATDSNLSANAQDAVSKRHSQNTDTSLDSGVFAVDANDGLDWTTGNVIYVPIGGDIATYIAAATAGDTLQLASGTYTITSELTINKLLNIKGQGQGITNIVCATDLAAGTMVNFTTTAGSRISDLTVSYTAASITGNTKIISGSVSFIARNVQILSTATQATSQYVYGIAGGNATIDAYCCTFNGSGAMSGNIGYGIGSTNTGTLNLYECYGTSSAGTNSSWGSTIISTENASSTINIYGGSYASATNTASGLVYCVTGNINIYNAPTINGSGATAFELKRTAGTLTVYDAILIGNKTSGTITYGGTNVGGNLMTSGNIFGSTFSTAKQHEEIGILLDNLTAPKAIIGFTGTGAASGTEAGYESGAGRTWTYNGTLTTDKIFKGATYVFSFDGVDAYLSTPDTADMSFGNSSVDVPFSIGGWIEVVNGSGTQVIIAKAPSIGTSATMEWGLYLTSSEVLVLSQSDASAGKIVTRATDSSLSVGWHYVVVTQSGTGGATAMNTALIYVDGIAVASTPTNDASYVSMEDLSAVVTVGNDLSTRWFLGDMGRIFVTAEALSAGTIWKLYERTRGFYNK